MGFWGGVVPKSVGIILPKGETPEFAIAQSDLGDGWAEAAVTKDAGDDPDVTHGALIKVRVSSGKGIEFAAGDGVGTVTKAGLPIEIGEPAINPVPRQMMRGIVEELAKELGQPADVKITISIPGGVEIAKKTWNGRLGIVGGLSILGTTGIVRPFSCAAWIASIHRGIDVARADGLTHVAGCTGATSEKIVQDIYDLPVHAMLDMGDFYGGLMKYLLRHPIDRITIGGGIGKIAKLAQGARDLHSGRSQVDFNKLNEVSLAAGLCDVSDANTAFEALERAGPALGQAIAQGALLQIRDMIGAVPISADVVVIDRAGSIVGRAS